MMSRERYLLRRCARLNQLCAAGRQTVRRVPPSGYDVTIYRGPLDEPVDLVVEADWSPGCCVSWDCPGEPEGCQVAQAWFKRRGTWRVVQLSPQEIVQVEDELN